MRTELLELGYQAGIEAVKQMRNNYIPFTKIQKQLFADEKDSMKAVSALLNSKCRDTMRTFMRWHMRGFERGVSDYIWENH